MAEGIDERPTVAPTNPSSPAPAAPSPSAAAPAVTPAVTLDVDSYADEPQPRRQLPATAPTRPDWLPEKFFDATKGPNLDEFGKHYAEVATRDAAEQVRRLALPQKPEDVKIELPKEFQLPQGVEFKFDATKPEFSKLQAAAVKHGLSSEAVSDLVGVYAETLVGSEATLNAAKQAEIGKLGANGPARVTALGTFFDGLLGETEGKQMKQMLVTAGIVQAAEKLVAKFSPRRARPRSRRRTASPAAPGQGVAGRSTRRCRRGERLDYAPASSTKANAEIGLTEGP